ncbi:unnamed protein product, partial [Ectocarpus sp. 8 AP-2014]
MGQVIVGDVRVLEASQTGTSLPVGLWATAVQRLGFENSSDKHTRKSHVLTACPSLDVFFFFVPSALFRRVNERVQIGWLACGRFFHFHRRRIEVRGRAMTVRLLEVWHQLCARP